MIKFSNRILTSEEGAEQDAEFAKEHFDFREESPESEPARPQSTNALVPADQPTLSVEMATPDDTTITKKSLEEYIAAFKSALLKSAESVLQAGRAAYEAKQSLSHFDFEKFCEEFGYRSESSAIRKWLAIGKIYLSKIFATALFACIAQRKTTWSITSIAEHFGRARHHA